MKRCVFLLAALFCIILRAVDISGPAFWKSVNVGEIEKWQQKQQEKKGLKLWRGVAADPVSGEVVVLAEAAGHQANIAVEFALIGSLSDRAYEALALTVATPGDIARAVESAGSAPGRCIGELFSQFWPYGNRFAISCRELPAENGAPFKPLSTLLRESDPANPLLPSSQVVFTSGRRERDGAYAADTNMPCSVVSLYNARDTIFDITGICGQSEAYGRIKTAKAVKQGTLIEFKFTPVRPERGTFSAKKSVVEVLPAGGDFELKLAIDGGVEKGRAEDILKRIKAEADKGYDIYLGIGFSPDLTVAQAAKAAALFAMLDGKGLRVDGVGKGALFYQAFLPKEQWRSRQGRNPQPFELHLKRRPDGALERKLAFIEEDWSGEELDPKLSVREYAFDDWAQLPGLVATAGGKDNKVLALFIFAPADLKLVELQSGIDAVSDRLPLVHIFSE